MVRYRKISHSAAANQITVKATQHVFTYLFISLGAMNRTPVVKSIIGSPIFLRNTGTKTGMFDEVLYDVIRQV